VASPSYLIELAKFGAQEYHHNTIRTIVSGGSAIFPEDAKLVLRTFRQSVFTIVFGSTEAEPISHCNAELLIFNEANKGIYVGQVDAMAEVRIIAIENDIPTLCKEEELKSLFCNQGEIGEIIVAGSHVLESYLGNDEQKKANKIRTETRLWHRTGDAGYLTNDDHLFLMGRVKQIFTSNKNIVYPFEVEKQLRKIQGVQLGTIIQAQNKTCLIYQSSHKRSETIFFEFSSRFSIDEIIHLTDIPVDPRHRSKIHYQKLVSLLVEK
jgi:acyl-CoA synthetase (AMP-forming)/AMP-acid ligase II